MNGEQNSNRINELLDEYEKGIKLIVPDNQTDAEIYLNMTYQDIAKLVRSQINEAVYSIARYASFVQKTINRHQAIKNWCESTIKLIIANEVVEYKAYYWEERKMLAIKANEKATKLYHLQLLAQTHIDNLYNLSEKLKFLSSTLYNITRNQNEYSK